MGQDEHGTVESLLPYEQWTEEATREVMLRALDHAAAFGMPGEHHFYITFRTDMPGVAVPAHLRARYPQEMTIVLQHQFWDLKVDRAARTVSVGLSFGQVPSTLVMPFAAITAFWDPYVRIGLRFGGAEGAAAVAPMDTPPEVEAVTPEPVVPDTGPQVVQLDAFRRRQD
ncbi:hypothetical protein C8P66_108146 [Humitalea rosea]|uniref:Stringent starvation protein B n=1 Tax=Humitalea rosea TaxID=990373 RepID=A0A2W7J5B5_9PROT|nr:ClpXP protease specificity-enhancing factor SspB [Humitalea rosea]PZW46866.1 hypothetical protein C8P66_108146 [Humitalea rosea]